MLNVVLRDEEGSCLPFSIEADYPFSPSGDDDEEEEDWTEVHVRDNKEAVDAALDRLQKRIDE